MTFILGTILGSLAGAGLFIAGQRVIERIRCRRVQRALPGIWWWYHWLSTWGFIGLTEAVRVRTESPDVTVDHEALDAIGASIGSVTRRVSLTYTPETPIWNEDEQHWEESDTQLRARIRGN